MRYSFNGSMLRQIRKDLFNMSQDEFSQKLGISQNTLSAVERESCDPSMDTFLKILDVCAPIRDTDEVKQLVKIEID